MLHPTPKDQFLHYDALLFGKKVVVQGEDGPLAQEISALFIQQGAQIAQDGQGDVLIYIAPERTDLSVPDDNPPCAQAAVARTASYMMDKRLGSILFMRPTQGLVSMLRALMMDFSKWNIRVNGIAVGSVGAPRLLQDEATLRDVAHAALFLASEMSAQVTGEVLTVDAGSTLAEGASA